MIFDEGKNMFKKIAFLCVNPLGNFLQPALQGCIRECYQWTRSEALLREENLYCQEKIEVYGETKIPYGKNMFGEQAETLQLLYVQSGRKELLEKVFSLADIVFVGLSGNKNECDKIFLTILPWIERAVFLYDNRICDEKYLKQIQGEYKLKDIQLMEMKKLPSILTEALIN